MTLYGNGSTDDKGITSYEWIKKSDSDKLAADMRVSDHILLLLLKILKRHISGTNLFIGAHSQ